MANWMNDGFAASSSGQPRPFPAIVVGGLIVGVLDLAYAIAVYSPRQPILVPQPIPSGILGLKSYSGGTTDSKSNISGSRLTHGIQVIRLRECCVSAAAVNFMHDISD